MLIKITPSLLAAAALLPTALGRMQCSFQTFKSTIEKVDFQSFGGLGGEPKTAGPWDEASIYLTPKYEEFVERADKYIAFKHWGSSCDLSVASANGPVCNGKMHRFPYGTSCAQVVQQTEKDGELRSVSAAVKMEEPVDFSGHLKRLGWDSSVTGTCARGFFKAPAEGMKVLTFKAHVPHPMGEMYVTLSQPDFNFGKSWLCAYDSVAFSNHPKVETEDGLTFKITGMKFDTHKHPSTYRDW